MSQQPGLSLPSVLPSAPALQDVNSTPEQINSNLGRVTNPEETPIYICVISSCNRLFPSKERLMAHRKVVHDTEDEGDILTWNQ